jgi:hypothetical protein
MVNVVPKSVSGVHEVRERFRSDAMLLDLHVVREIFEVRNLLSKASGFRSAHACMVGSRREDLKPVACSLKSYWYISPTFMVPRSTSSTLYLSGSSTKAIL